MGLQVPCNVEGSSGAVVTTFNWATKWFDARVDPHVRLQVCGLEDNDDDNNNLVKRSTDARTHAHTRNQLDNFNADALAVVEVMAHTNARAETIVHSLG